MGRTDFIRLHVRSYADLERDGIALAVSDARVRYHAGARYDDLVQIETTLMAVRSRALVFDYRITRQPDGAQLATATTTLVSIDREGKVTAMPAALRAKLATVIG